MQGNDSSRKYIILLIITGLAVGGLMVMTVSCAEGVKCTDIKTMFCAIIKNCSGFGAPALSAPLHLFARKKFLYWQVTLH